ncbi:hypothetical protein NUH88_13710 [Nisaea acidiphila]|uniref:Secreted protein n=1 Tax=Nisaea acidiphila TaxID=1862145 RepID=A0A9J7AMR7_9PROT|nr:hypothetical protein [Nisaea acidiphila]UUX48463.1 hypothetical protein NUH88_13710 [Nisaea acidiphila]
MTTFRACAALAVLLTLAAGQVSAQSRSNPPAKSRTTEVFKDEAFPSSGLGATTLGERVLLLPDGTWKVDDYYAADEVTAVTDHGRTVVLTRKTDPASKDSVLQWEYTRGHGGPIQIVVSRAITTDRSQHSKNDNCIPVLTVRNLTSLGLFRIVAELQFTGPNNVKAATSIMAGPLDDGEQGDFLSGPLFLDSCDSLTAELHIPFCQFENGLDCSSVVAASAYGTIPTVVGKEQAAVSKVKSN